MIFNNEYRELTEEEKEQVKMVKDQADILYSLIGHQMIDPRMQALAKTKLEECVMWAVKGITS